MPARRAVDTKRRREVVIVTSHYMRTRGIPMESEARRRSRARRASGSSRDCRTVSSGHADQTERMGDPRDIAFDTTTEFRRDLGVVSAASVVLGTVIGSGIFIAPSLVLQQVGTPGLSLLVWLVTGVCALFGVLCCAELAAMMPRAGGAFVYPRHAFPPWVAFLFGWTSFFVMQPSALALISDVFVTHLDHRPRRRELSRRPLRCGGGCRRPTPHPNPLPVGERESEIGRRPDTVPESRATGNR